MAGFRSCSLTRSELIIGISALDGRFAAGNPSNSDDQLLLRIVPGDGANLADPDGALPSLSFLKVPEWKVVKNRLHIDVQAGGGRDQPWEERRLRVVAAVERLVAAGATVICEDVVEGRLDHVVMADPEGNELPCLSS